MSRSRSCASPCASSLRSGPASTPCRRPRRSRAEPGDLAAAPLALAAGRASGPDPPATLAVEDDPTGAGRGPLPAAAKAITSGFAGKPMALRISRLALAASFWQSPRAEMTAVAQLAGTALEAVEDVADPARGQHGIARDAAQLGLVV